MRPQLLATAMFAALTATAIQAEPPAAQPEAQRHVCRGGERQLGTHMRTRRRCRTAEQWRAEDEAAARLPPSLQVTPGQNDGRAPAQPR